MTPASGIFSSLPFSMQQHMTCELIFSPFQIFITSLQCPTIKLQTDSSLYDQEVLDVYRLPKNKFATSCRVTPVVGGLRDNASAVQVSKL